MLKVVTTINGRTTAFLGLDRANTERLHAGQPIKVDLHELTIGATRVDDVVLCAGETLDDIHAELSRFLPNMPPIQPPGA